MFSIDLLNLTTQQIALLAVLATLIAAAVGSFTAFCVALVNFWAAKRLARLNARREYLAKVLERPVAFGERRHHYYSELFAAAKAGDGPAFAKWAQRIEKHGQILDTMDFLPTSVKHRRLDRALLQLTDADRECFERARGLAQEFEEYPAKSLDVADLPRLENNIYACALRVREEAERVIFR